jgi:hypothetical protein
VQYAGIIPGQRRIRTQALQRFIVEHGSTQNLAEGSSYLASQADGLNFEPSFSILKCVLVTKS